MVRVAEPIPPKVPQVQPGQADERAARRDLREQVARLERELQQTLVTSFPRTGLDVTPPPRRMAGPRVLSLGELEDLRDRLSEKLGSAREELRIRVDREQEC